MNWLDYSKLIYHVYIFDNDEIRIFDKNKRFFCYLMIILNLFELFKSSFHSYFNNNKWRLYLTGKLNLNFNSY